jgi:hypothetical protein
VRSSHLGHSLVNDSSGETERIMTALSKTFLAVSVTGFMGGSIIDFGGLSVIPALTVVLPVGAVFFGFFLISFMLEKEMAKFDQEKAGNFEPSRRNGSGDSKCKNCGHCRCQPEKTS